MGEAMKWRNFLVGGLCLVALVACNKQKPETKTADQAAATGQAVATTPAATGAESGIQQPANPAGKIKGKAKEVLSGGGFTYVLVAAEKGDTWVAVPKTKVEVGETCSIAEGQVMKNFPSKTLNRTFNEIVFSPGIEGKKPEIGEGHDGDPGAAAPAAKSAPAGAAAPAGAFGAAMQKEGGAAPGAPAPAASGEAAPGSGKAVVPFVELKIAKASGANGYTVADIFGKAASLNGKKVKIKAQVVKFSPEIMGKNWLHLQDGTGDPLKNTHDLVVTTTGKAEKGDIVTVEGVVAADKDFGAGYKYAVIVEDVSITR
ncbi:MAG: DNA-binding protein [Deltaproteobacteria bacterium]|nr:DNA-binding protein [Deltaproteobacteria bacterium]